MYLGTLLLAVQLNVFISFWYGYFTLFEYILRIKILKMRKRGQSQSFFERTKFYAEWDDYSHACKRRFLKSLTGRYIFQLKVR